MRNIEEKLRLKSFYEKQMNDNKQNANFENLKEK